MSLAMATPTPEDRVKSVKSAVLKLHQDLCSNTGRFSAEYEHLETTTEPMPGNPGAQHDAMVDLGLCREAVKYTERNRYSNQYPLDCNLVRVPGLAYINASWIRLESLESKHIITMGPLHPKSFSGANQSDYGRVGVCNSRKGVKLVHDNTFFYL